MTPQANVRSVQALGDLKTALVRFSADAQEALRSAAVDIARTLEWLAGREEYWRREVRQREEAMRQASAALARCQASGYYDRDGRYYAPDCSAYEQALAKARARLREAQEELLNVQRCTRVVQEAVAEYERQARHLATALENDLPQAEALLERKMATLSDYFAVAIPSLRDVMFGASSLTPDASARPGAGAGGGALDPSGSAHVGIPGHSGEEATAAPARGSGPSARSDWEDTGIREVPLSEVDLSDSPVHGPEDFRKVSEVEMREGLDKFAEVVRPAVEAGHGADYFSELDTAQGLDCANGYRRVYDAFYGDDAIRLERVGDRYTVVNGFHRLHVATDLGWSSIPARVIEPR